MEHTNRKRRKIPPVLSEGLDHARKRIRTEVSLSAGLSPFDDLSPDVFAARKYKAEFDAVGKAKAAEMAGASDEKHTPRKSEPAVNNVEDNSRARCDDSFSRRFVSYAFQGGRLAGAVLNGEAKTVFITCVARSMSSNEKQRRVNKSFAHRENIDGAAVSAAFGDDIKSAVEITASAARGASEILDAFTKLACGVKTPQGEFVETIARLYPFLSTDGEKALIERCRERLKNYRKRQLSR